MVRLKTNGIENVSDRKSSWKSWTFRDTLDGKIKRKLRMQ